MTLVERAASQPQTPAALKDLDGFRDRGIENIWIFMRPSPAAAPLCCSLLMEIKSGCNIDGSQGQGPQGDLVLTFSFLLFHSPAFTASAAPGERLVMTRECAESATATVPSQAVWVTEEEIRCSGQHTSPSHHLPDMSSVIIGACAHADSSS